MKWFIVKYNEIDINNNDVIKEEEVFDAFCVWRNFEVMIKSKYIKMCS